MQVISYQRGMAIPGVGLCFGGSLSDVLPSSLECDEKSSH